MAIKTEQVEKNLVKITFEVSAEDFDKATDKVYLKNKNTAYLSFEIYRILENCPLE